MFGISLPNPLKALHKAADKVIHTTETIGSDVIKMPGDALHLASGVVDFFDHPKLDAKTYAALKRLASVTPKPNQTWSGDRPLADAKNAHRTNTPAEFQAALKGDYNYFESDIRLEGGLRGLPGLPGLGHREAICAHDPNATNGLSLSEWLALGKTSGRGLKLDIKQAAAVPEIIREVKAAGVDESKLLLNGDVGEHDGTAAKLLNAVQDNNFTVDDYKKLRAAFPKATIAMAPHNYDAKALDQAASWAKAVGGKITFPVELSSCTPELIKKLKPYGQISIWNDPKSDPPADIAAETQRLRDMGVDGMIDLRQKAE
jgi:hypothetical protein